MSSPIAMRVRCQTPAAMKENRTDQIACPFRRGRNSTHPAHWFASALSSLLQQVRLPSLSPSLISKGAGFFARSGKMRPLARSNIGPAQSLRRRDREMMRIVMVVGILAVSGYAVNAQDASKNPVAGHDYGRK